MSSTSSGLEDLGIADTLGLGNGRRLRIRRWLAWGTAALLAIAVIAIWQIGQHTETSRYVTLPVERGDLTVTISATGTLEPTNTVDVGTEVSGTIATVAVDYNDRVKVGQILAQLDTSKLQAQVLQAEAALAAARAKVLQTQASVRETQLQFQRLQQLRQAGAGGYVSEHDVDAAEAALDRARADAASAAAAVRQTQATLDAHRTDLSKAVIVSPIDGVVLQRSVEPGQTVAATFQAPVLFTLAENLSQMELQADIDEADVGQVREGQDATFTVDAYPERRFPARIRQLRFGSQIVDGVVTYKAILQVANPDLSLRPGMTATAQVVTAQVRDALLVPNAALRFAPPQEEQASSGSFISRLTPRPGRLRPPPPQDLTSTNADAADAARVWVLRDGAPAPVTVRTGLSDGTRTVLLDAQLAADTPVITDVLSAE
ncbi:MAG: efflux RND transporter periplasmic adaptor subunit [Pseudomonadota bacterium]